MTEREVRRIMTLMRRDLPSGTVTFLFTDVEGSTKLLHELGPERYAEALAEHRRVLRQAFQGHGGAEVDTQGDAFFYAFPTAPGALEAAQDALAGLSSGPIRVRMGIHTGTPHLAEEGYVGADVHRAARIAACAHGGQVLVSSSTASLLETNGLRDLGEHRLKDLSAPERLYQLGDAEFPPLKSLHQTNLPVPATPFLGREKELGDVVGLLSKEGLRLLTLTGPGGTGKTRLGLQAAADVIERYPDGVWWVPLAPLRDPQLVLESAGRALGATDGLAEHVADKSLLLLLDNFEHVVEASAELPDLLAACPNLELLVTSRELLGVPGEQAYPVPPLAADEGTELFLTRARAALPTFEPSAAVPELCERLENLPLALELAAARVRVLSPEQLLERLSRRLDLLTAGRGVEARQQTLRATIEWSYDLCSPEEQSLFRGLSVFRGGWTLDAAENVCDADLDVLQSLVDKSLVRVREADRFWMLETIREYAAERLESSGEADQLRRRHAEHFLAVAEEAEPHLRGNPKEWLDRLDAEHDNLRAALDELESVRETQLSLRLAGALWKFWNMRGHLREGRRRLESALAADERPTAARANVLNGAAAIAVVVERDFATARLRAEEALRLHTELGDAWGSAYATFLFGFAAVEQGKFEEAPPHLEESLRLFRELGDDYYTGVVSFNLAWAYEELGDRERARALTEDSLRRARATGNERQIAFSLDQLELLARQEGRPRDALQMLREGLRIRVDQHDPVHIADSLSRFASALAQAGEAEIATQLLSRSVAANEEIRIEVPLYQQKRNEETLASLRAQLDEASFAEAWEQGRALSTDEAVALALGS